jgi:pyruvate dehydrogenase E2 component (dihydrolipoamide acetyltransferase)
LAPLQGAQVAGKRIRSSPLVRRIAEENQLDLGQIAGSGLEGRITKEDVLRQLRRNGPASVPPRRVRHSGRSCRSSCFSARSWRPGGAADARCGPSSPSGWWKAWQISPHVHIVYKVDMTRIARLREREKAHSSKSTG